MFRVLEKKNECIMKPSFFGRAVQHFIESKGSHEESKFTFSNLKWINLKGGAEIQGDIEWET